MEELNKEQPDIAGILKSLKILLLSIFLLIVGCAILGILFEVYGDVNIFTPENYPFGSEYGTLIFLIPAGVPGYFFLYSISRLAKSLNKNASSWYWTCFFVPMVAIFIAVPYLSFSAFYIIIKIKLKIKVEQFVAWYHQRRSRFITRFDSLKIVVFFKFVVRLWRPMN